MRGVFFLLLCGIQVNALTLKEAEQMALSNNPEVRAAEELLEMARQGHLEAISRWLPQLSIASQGYALEKPIKQLKLTQPSAFMTQLSLTQTLFSPQMFHQIKFSALMIEQFSKLLEAARNDILFQTRALYYLIALDLKKLKTAQENIDLLQFLADRMERKKRIGESTLYHVNQARVAMVNVTDTYFQAEKNLKNHRDQMVQLLGFLPSETTFELSQEELDVEHYPVLKEKVLLAEEVFQEGSIIKSTFIELEKQIMNKLFAKGEFRRWNIIADNLRPDLQLSRTYVKLAKENIRLKKSEYWPTLSFLGNYGGAPTPFFFQPSTEFSNQQFQWGVGFSLNWAIFDGTGRSRRVKKAQAEARAVAQNAKKSSQIAETEVREQLYKMEEALAKYLSSSSNYKLSKETLEQAKSQLEIGYVTIYDYLISVDGHIRAKTAFDEGKYGLLAAYFGLLHASGKESD
ncbi:MAG: TolC family protein [Rhabdochlamydiaceae bacterium]